MDYRDIVAQITLFLEREAECNLYFVFLLLRLLSVEQGLKVGHPEYAPRLSQFPP